VEYVVQIPCPSAVAHFDMEGEMKGRRKVGKEKEKRGV
jgi:hypothetical protein